MAPPLQAPVAAPAQQGCESCPAEARKCKRGGCPGKQILLQALKRQKEEKKKKKPHMHGKSRSPQESQRQIPSLLRYFGVLSTSPSTPRRSTVPKPRAPSQAHTAPTPRPWVASPLRQGTRIWSWGLPGARSLLKPLPHPSSPCVFFLGNPTFGTRSRPQSSGWLWACDPAPKPGGFQEHNQLVGHKTTACEKPGRLPGASEAAPGWPLSSKWPRSAPPALLSQHSDH